MDGYVTIGTMIDTKDFDAQMNYIEEKMLDIEDKLEKADMGFEVGDTLKLEAEYEKLGNQLLGLKEKQQKYNQSIKDAEMAGFNRIKDSIDDIGTSMSKITKKVVKWGLAIFGIRGIYMGIRQAVSQVLAEDETLKYQIDYIKWSMGQAIKPIVEFIVNLVYKIVGGVGAIIKLLFGINIFSKATANNFKNANANAGKLKKTLAGFDEMNILNEDGSVGIANTIDNALSGFGDLSTEVDSITEKIKNWFTHVPTKEEWQQAVDYMKTPWEAGINYLKDKVWNPFYNNILEGVEMLRPMWEPLYNEFVYVIENKIKPEWEGMKNILIEKAEELRPIWEPMKNAFIEKKDEMLMAYAPFLNRIIDGINQVIGVFGWHLDYIEIQSEQTANNIEGDFNEIGNKSQDAGNTIEGEIGGALDSVENSAENLANQDYTINMNKDQVTETENSVNSIWDTLWNLVNKHWDIQGTFNWAGNAIESIKHFFGFAKGGIVVPKLASGGIINQPGRGVPIGSAIGGERGMEGVLPLTDSQQMALLGEAIGKYITVAPTIPVYVGNRMVAREMRKINAEESFAGNR